jgi:hypothetical protein
MDSAKKHATGIEPEFSTRGVKSCQPFEDKSRKRSALLHLFEDALMDEIEKLRHHGKGSDVSFAQRP